MKTTVRRTLGMLIGAALLTLSALGNAEPLKIGYSDWPGWVAWEVAVDKGWFKEAGVDVSFEWFDYVASMDAFAAGQLDAVSMTNGDALVTGATGAKSVMILMNDYSNGNDMVIGAPGIGSVKDLKGKKVGVEVGFVGHLLLLNALEKSGLTEADVELVNVPTNETPQVLASGEVDAIVAWQLIIRDNNIRMYASVEMGQCLVSAHRAVHLNARCLQQHGRGIDDGRVVVDN